MDLTVLDLGCGTGIFAIASWIMGSSHSLGIDIDRESIEEAMKTTNDLIGLNQLSHIDESNLNFIVGDINQYNSIYDLLNDSHIQTNENYGGIINFNHSNSAFKFDTLFQNPPFGVSGEGNASCR